MTSNYDAGNPATEERGRRELELQRGNDMEVLRGLLRTKASRLWLYRLLQSCHIYDLSFSGEDTHMTAFQLGRENVGKRLMLEAIDANSDGYVLMVKEGKAEEERKAQVVREQNERQEKGADAPRAEDQLPYLPPPEGYPGHEPLDKPKSEG